MPPRVMLKSVIDLHGNVRERFVTRFGDLTNQDDRDCVEVINNIAGLKRNVVSLFLSDETEQDSLEQLRSIMDPNPDTGDEEWTGFWMPEVHHCRIGKFWHVERGEKTANYFLEGTNVGVQYGKHAVLEEFANQLHQVRTGWNAHVTADRDANNGTSTLDQEHNETDVEFTRRTTKNQCKLAAINMVDDYITNATQAAANVNHEHLVGRYVFRDIRLLNFFAN